jgi:hypothetical protein
MDLWAIILLGLGVGALLLGRARRADSVRPVPPRAARPPTGPTRTSAPAASPAGLRRAGNVDPNAEATDPDLEPSAAPAAPEASPPPPSERRKHPRIRSDQTFEVIPFAGRPMMAQCCDISTGGMRFGVVGCTLRAGDLVRVTFNIGNETVGAIGSVLRIRELDPITSDVSLQFVRVDPWASQLLEQALAAED